MIISRVIGGLGNQMFQYAAGRTLALKRKCKLLLDISEFEGYGLHHGFELHRVFRCEGAIASDSDLRDLLGWRAAPVVRRVLARPAFSALRGETFVVEPHFHYWPGLDDVPERTYLHGYWQSEKYFREAAATLREDFAFRQPLTEANLVWADRIRRAVAVSVHVRRGDYVSDPRTHAAHSVCSLEYYLAAVEQLARRVEAPEFFVFSDDKEWVRSHFRPGFPCHYVDNNRGAESYNDMRLMSLCRHHITANSSFSWWGAWLAASAPKIVIGPKQWFHNAQHDTSDLIPDSWIRI